MSTCLVLQLYTAAINACMANDGTNFDAALEIYTTMQRNGVEPDDLLYGHLIALAGRCKKLEVGLGSNLSAISECSLHLLLTSGSCNHNTLLVVKSACNTACLRPLLSPQIPLG